MSASSSVDDTKETSSDEDDSDMVFVFCVLEILRRFCDVFMAKRDEVNPRVCASENGSKFAFRNLHPTQLLVLVVRTISVKKQFGFGSKSERG